MSTLRFKAIEKVESRPVIDVKLPSGRISDYYGTHVFDVATMREFLSSEAFRKVMAAIRTGEKIDRQIADQIASSMKAWAIDKGATHFTHWFQPLTGSTAEKHDSFFVPTEDGRGIEKFNGEALVQQEPDASSFPSGGLRATFEARGYTAWDPSSPAFIMEIGNGRTLCIPTIFVSYNGEALDYKAPLLKSMQVLEEAAVTVCRYFDRNVEHVSPTLGWEQEYFLVDEALFHARPDLVLTGRTVLGHAPAKGQQLEDHYFGSIHERVYRYMMELEYEAYKLGIPLRTRHNEVAPGQYECAPTFEEVNLAVDHNQLLMDLMDRIARRHHMRVLLHEKPFARINGSGKHNNWSLQTDRGKNLLSPGKTPKTNFQFLTFFVTTIRAVAEYGDLLRASIATAGNDHRLGANEAPPAIISVFIGSHLQDVLDEVEKRVSKGSFDEMDKGELKMDIHKRIPDLLLDNTDRNRTSPFAFTGNKFEIRAVGSASNCASPMIVMNTIVARQLRDFHERVEALIEAGDKKDMAILKVLEQYIRESRKVLFEGDNYSEAWAEEAARRGLSNIKSTPQALDAYVRKESIALFEEMGVYSAKEIHARHEIQLENYAKRIQIEARVIGDLSLNHILPAAISYQNRLAANVKSLRDSGLEERLWQAQAELLLDISTRIQEIKRLIDEMVEERKKANKMDDAREKAIAYCETIKPYFDRIRYHVDKLEQVVDDELWPLPKYRELLFMK